MTVRIERHAHGPRAASTRLAVRSGDLGDHGPVARLAAPEDVRRAAERMAAPRADEQVVADHVEGPLSWRAEYDDNDNDDDDGEDDDEDNDDDSR